MPRPAYQLPPLDPSNERVEVRVPPAPNLNIREALTETYMMEIGARRGPAFRTKGPGYLYDFSPQGGPVVYSPNCLRPDLIPPGPHINYKTDSILRGRDYDLPLFSQPQFWSRSQGYFAFLPRTPINMLLPTFCCLRRLPTARQSNTSNRLYPHHARFGEWTDLQTKVVRACYMMGRCIGLPTAYPAWPCARVQTTKYVDEAQLEVDVSNAKGWFSVWLGILAYEVAALSRMGAKSSELGLTRIIPTWMDILLDPPQPSDDPLDEVFVTDISQSVCRFDGSIARVGTFIVIPNDYDLEMVSVDWLISLNVPVFWEWGEREVDIAKEKPYFKRFEPPSDVVDVFKVWPHMLSSKSKGMNDDKPKPQDQHSHHTIDQCPPHSTPAQESQTQSVPPPPVSPYTFLRSKFRRRPDPTEAQLVEWRRSETLRKEAAVRREALETSAQRTLRLARERNPPTRKGKVTMWLWSLEGDGDGVYRPEKADDLDMAEMFSIESPFSRDQAIYDSFSAAWHIADFLGRPTDAQLDHMAAQNSEYHGTPYLLEIKLLRVWYHLDDIPSESPHEMKLRLNAENAQSQCARGKEDGVKVEEVGNPNIGDEPMNTELIDGAMESGVVDKFSGARDDIEVSAYRLFGYLAPFLDIAPKEPPSSEARSIIGFLLGRQAHGPNALDSDYWETHQGRSLGLFAAALSNAKLVEEMCAEGSWKITLNWDVGRFNRHSVQSLQRFSRLECTKADFEEECAVWHNVEGLVTSSTIQTTRVYMFGGPSEHDWYLGCTSSAVALHICRLDKAMDTTDIARDLLGRGFRFHTFARFPSDDPPPRIPLVHNHNPKRYRPADYKWSKRDYDSWVGALKTFLRSERGRAAFLRGGLVWRIAMEFALPDDVMLGPSRPARQGLGIVRQDSSKRHYFDDSLSAEEIDFICGVHYVYIKATPKKEKIPPPSLTQSDRKLKADKNSTTISPCPSKLDEQPATISVPPAHGDKKAKAIPTLSPSSSSNDNNGTKPAPALSPPPSRREQLQRLSYFPPEDAWLELYGLLNGWPEDAEAKFTQNQAELVSKGFQPTSRAVWKRRLRKPGSIAQIAQRLERVSDVAITEANHVFDHTL